MDYTPIGVHENDPRQCPRLLCSPMSNRRLNRIGHNPLPPKNLLSSLPTTFPDVSFYNSPSEVNTSTQKTCKKLTTSYDTRPEDTDKNYDDFAMEQEINNQMEAKSNGLQTGGGWKSKLLDTYVENTFV